MEVCKKITQINFSGNIIPVSWFKYIRKGKRNNPDFVAIFILSDIIYWYRLIEIRDETTGQIIGYRKKFKHDKLQKSYESYAKLLGVPKKTVKESFKLLESLGLITIEFRTIDEEGLKLSNVMFVEPNPEKIKEITYPIEDIPLSQKEAEVYPKKGRGSIPNWDRGGSQIGIEVLPKLDNTNTENTTKITTENTNNILFGASSSQQSEYSQDFQDNKHEEFSLPLREGSEFIVTEEYIQELSQAFVNVDVKQELKKMRAWLEANPARRKTQRRIKRFIVNWLSKCSNNNSTSSDGNSDGSDSSNNDLDLSKIKCENFFEKWRAEIQKKHPVPIPYDPSIPVPVYAKKLAEHLKNKLKKIEKYSY